MCDFIHRGIVLAVPERAVTLAYSSVDIGDGVYAA